MHPDDDADRRAEESERRMFERSLYCPKCGNKRLSVGGRWRCYGCDGAPVAKNAYHPACDVYHEGGQ